MLGVSGRILYSIDSYLYVSCSGSITSFGEERDLSAIVYLYDSLVVVNAQQSCKILAFFT